MAAVEEGEGGEGRAGVGGEWRAGVGGEGRAGVGGEWRAGRREDRVISVVSHVYTRSMVYLQLVFTQLQLYYYIHAIQEFVISRV